MRARGVPTAEEQANMNLAKPPKLKHNCNLPSTCPDDHFAFHIKSGVTNVIGPSICFNGQIIMSGVKNNIGQGLNIVIANGETGNIEKSAFFNMYNGDPKELLALLEAIKPGMIILVATFDDPATKLTKEIREAFSNLGSTSIKSVKFRDNWVFAGALGTLGMEGESPFEKLLKNNKETNVYEGWPSMVEVGGCFPKII
ncbi:protein FAM3C-like isoform X2 [Megalops cyprinoides]|uniref:protein FAM3C-like isoform X2 n=1 Tax=Megalops cyprinoides TaxID=118141 RepID=UPI0018655B90|nr:protein FAM3C-like isoform X2 [Megalops cyprinoides]